MNITTMIKYLYGNKIKLMLYSSVLLLFIVIIIVLLVIFIAWISYICIKYMKLKMFGQLNNITDYNVKSKSVLDIYGDLKIKRIYLIKTPIDTIIDLLFNLLSLYHWNKYKQPVTHHIFLLFEVEVERGVTKHVLVEKINGIYVNLEYIIKESNQLIPIKFNKRKTYTINSILESTKKRIGLFNFYNWSLNSHCQIFTYNILKTIRPKTKYKQYFDMKWFSSSFNNMFHEFSIHLLNWCLKLSSYHYTT